jgi:hypothetical protein
VASKTHRNVLLGSAQQPKVMMAKKQKTKELCITRSHDAESLFRQKKKN